MLAGWPIDGIADDGIANGLQMDANLMGAPRFELQEEQCVTAKTLHNAKMRARLAAARCCNRHLLAVARVASDRRINAASIKSHDAFHQSEVAFDDGMLF